MVRTMRRCSFKAPTGGRGARHRSRTAAGRAGGLPDVDHVGPDGELQPTAEAQALHRRHHRKRQALEPVKTLMYCSEVMRSCRFDISGQFVISPTTQKSGPFVASKRA